MLFTIHFQKDLLLRLVLAFFIDFQEDGLNNRNPSNPAKYREVEGCYIKDASESNNQAPSITRMGSTLRCRRFSKTYIFNYGISWLI